VVCPSSSDFEQSGRFCCRCRASLQRRPVALGRFRPLPGDGHLALLTFTISLDEFVVALFLSGTEPSLPVNIWTWLRFPREVPSVLALSTLILLSSIVLAFAALMIARIGAPDTPVWGGKA